jgi:hypothetical protein
MNIAIILVIAAVVALAIILRLSISGRLQVSDSSGLASRIEPLDIEAFRNLVNPAEDAYLRRRLPPAEFRHVRRERLHATAAYVRAASRNAAILVRIGQTALASSNPNTAEAARQLVDQALLLRRNAAFALLRIYVTLAWPGESLAAAPVLDSYRDLSGAAMLLGRLQNPAAPVRISAS